MPDLCRAAGSLYPPKILEYQRVLDALAAGEFELALEYSKAIGNTKTHLKAHPFDKALGLAVKTFVEAGDIETALDGLAEYAKKDKKVAGILALLRAMAARDTHPQRT
ncbi:MAG: hypothetical protein ACE5I3_11865 [Phycisphaerae bacterium]